MIHSVEFIAENELLQGEESDESRGLVVAETLPKYRDITNKKNTKYGVYHRLSGKLGFTAATKKECWKFISDVAEICNWDIPYEELYKSHLAEAARICRKAYVPKSI